ncbi:MAG: hypothetical protein LC662_06900, partial [Rhodothermaceae bacterium]|nr:hypothetical protein [Rhodothermaceae bacterium]
IDGGELAGRYMLYETGIDSSLAVRVPQPVGVNADYVFSIDLNGDGYDVNDDWISDLDAPNGVVRQLSVPTSEPLELPAVQFDNLPLSVFDTGYEAQWLRPFQSGSTGLSSLGNTKVRLQLQNLDRGTIVNTRRFMKDPGGSLPEGVAIMANNILWEIHRSPQAAGFSATAVMIYDLIAGDVHKPEDLRLLFMPEGASEWEVLTTSVDQNNQTLTSTGLMEIAGRWTIGSTSLNNLGELLPDLSVTTITAPVSVFSGREIELGWTVTNSGARPTNVPAWYDRVYISQSLTFNRNESILLGRFENVTYLTDGGSYNNSAKVRLPDGLSGTWHLFVETDGDNTQQELDEENNISGPGTVEITLSPYADLQVVSLVTSPNVFSGDSISVQWTVENMGSGPAEAAEWFDHIILAAGSELDFNFTNDEELIRINDTEIGWLKREGALQPGESYTVSSRFKLPDDAIGDYFLFVYTDLDRSGGKRFYRGRVFELNQEFNNWLGEAVNIVLTPPPDLVPVLTPLPVSAMSGERITVAWEVENQGPGATRSAGWTDAVFLSASPELDLNEAFALGVQSYNPESPLIPDAAYPGSMEVDLPDGIDGTWYAHVYTDRFSDVFEYTFSDNNIALSEPIAIQRSLYPDLSASGVEMPPVVTAGERIGVTWQVTNGGEKASVGTRTDNIYVSSSPEWNAEEAILLDKVNQPRPAGIGETQTFTHLVRLPHDLLGTHYLYVLVNADSTVFEYPDASDNLGRSGPAEVSAYPPPDLAIEQLTIPATATSGQPASFGWTIKNAGSGATQAPQWDEVIYLAAVNDIPFDSDQAVPVGRIVRKGELPAGESYERTIQATIPDGVSGDYYVIVATEKDSLNGDTDPSNNVIVSEA